MPSNFFGSASTKQQTMHYKLLAINELINRCHDSNIEFTGFTEEKSDSSINDHSLQVFQDDVLSALNNEITLFVNQQLNVQTRIIYSGTSLLAQTMMSVIFNNLSYFFKSLQPNILKQLFDNMKDVVSVGVPNACDLLCVFFHEMDPLMYSVVITTFENSLFQELTTFEKILIILPPKKCISFLNLIKPIMLSRPKIFNPAESSLICRYEELSSHLCDQKRQYLYDVLKLLFGRIRDSNDYAIYLQNLPIDQRPDAFNLIKKSMILTVSDFENILMYHEEPVRQLVFEDFGVEKLQSLVLKIQSEDHIEKPNTDAVLDFLLTYTPRSVFHKNALREVEKLNHDIQSKTIKNDVPLQLSASLKEFTNLLYENRVKAGHLGRVLKYIPLQHYLEFCNHLEIRQLITYDITLFWIIMTPLSKAQRAIIYDLVKTELPLLTRVRCHNSSYESNLMMSVLTPNQAIDVQERSQTTQGSYYSRIPLDDSEYDSNFENSYAEEFTVPAPPDAVTP